MCNVTRSTRVPFTWSRVMDFPPPSWNMARCFVSRAVRVVGSSGEMMVVVVSFVQGCSMMGIDDRIFRSCSSGGIIARGPSVV